MVLTKLEGHIERETEYVMSTPRRRYTQKFKDQLVQEVIEFSKPIAEVAREYGVAAQSLGNWVKNTVKLTGLKLAKMLRRPPTL